MPRINANAEAPIPGSTLPMRRRGGSIAKAAIVTRSEQGRFNGKCLDQTFAIDPSLVRLSKALPGTKCFRIGIDMGAFIKCNIGGN